MRIRSKTARHLPRRTGSDIAVARRHRVTRAGAVTMAALAAVAVTNTAWAEDTPTTAELLDQCGSADVCQFTPKEEWKTVANEQQVGSSYWNCTTGDQQASISWSETKGQSNNVSVSVEVGASFFKVLEAAVTTTYDHGWEFSHTWTENPIVTIPGDNVGWITRGAPMQNVRGDYELHFGDRYYGHYFWYVTNFVETGPDSDGTGQVAFHTRPMTDQEKTAHCSSTDPGSLTESPAIVANGSGQVDDVLSSATSQSPTGSTSAGIISAD
jgi:hypothetical protein